MHSFRKYLLLQASTPEYREPHRHLRVQEPRLPSHGTVSMHIFYAVLPFTFRVFNERSNTLEGFSVE